VEEKMSAVLVVGDLHAPATHEKYLSFCKKISRKYNTNKTVFIGDIVDHEAISRHEKNPDLPSAHSEYLIAQKQVNQWYRAFPNAVVCIGNHDERVMRRAKSEGIPSLYLKPYNDVYGTRGWTWAYDHVVDGILYTHGTNWSGKTPAFNAACYLRRSVVCGHLHSVASISHHNNGTDTIFGMNVGCGVDAEHLAMLYGRYSLKKPFLSCGVVKDGHPYLEVM
jgi:hypothetical protein